MNLDQVLDRLGSPRKSAGGHGYLCQCPAHDDEIPSLSVSLSSSGAISLICFGGCTIDQVTAAIGLRPFQLEPTAVRKGYKRHKTQAKYESQMVPELTLILNAMQFRELGDRSVDQRERETLAAKRIVGALKVLYDV